MTDEELMSIADSVGATVCSVAMEALTEVFHRMPFGQKIQLANGKTATIKKFVSPKVDDGTPRFLFDVQFDDGSGHIEFCVEQSGWEGSVAK